MFINVALENGIFLYEVPKSFHSQVKIGSLVQVPLRTREVEGWIIEIYEKVPQKLSTSIKKMTKICYPIPLISHKLIELGKWMGSYYQVSLGVILNTMVPTPGKAIYKEDKILTYQFKGKRSIPPLIISDSLKHGKYKSILLYGKERKKIYFQTIEEVLRNGKSVIFLVPETRLASEVLFLLEKEFGKIVALLHSKLRKEERWNEWIRIKEGIARIVVGTMSAIFSPVHRLGAIIVDEEHDISYKSEKKPRYLAIDVGKKRAEIEGCLYISGSNTPRIETLYETERKRSTLIRLIPSFPKTIVHTVDMRKETDAIFSGLLKEKLKEYINKKEKIVLFLNRRGFSSFIMCEDCGYIPKCPNCAISLAYYRRGVVLKCHYCGHKERAIGYCPQCKGINLSYKGIGTGRVEKAFKELFPKVKIFRLELESVSSKYVGHIFNLFTSGEFQVLLGTQLIAKPINFPQIGLVGIISSDTSLNLPDFRAPEYTFALLMRLIEKGKEVVLQTYNPSHRVIKHLTTHKYFEFYKYEKLARKTHNYPPYSHLVRIVVENKDKVILEAKVSKIASQLKKWGIRFLGPSPCYIEYKKTKFRMHFLLKTQDPAELDLTKIISSDTIVDVDPIHFV